MILISTGDVTAIELFRLMRCIRNLMIFFVSGNLLLFVAWFPYELSTEQEHFYYWTFFVQKYGLISSFFIVLAEYLRAMQHLSDNQQRSVSSEANAAALYRQYQAAAGMSQPVMLRPGLQMPQEGNSSSQGRSSHGSSNLQPSGSHSDRGQNPDHGSQRVSARLLNQMIDRSIDWLTDWFIDWLLNRWL